MPEGPVGGPRPLSDAKLAVVFTPESGNEVGEDRIIQHRNKIISELEAQFISVDDIDVLNEQETSAALGGFSDQKSVRVVANQVMFDKAAPTTKAQINTMQKEIVKRTGEVLSDNFALFVL